MRTQKWPMLLACVACVLLAGCGFHLRRSAALPPAMQQQVYLQMSGGEFARSLAAALRAGKVRVLDQPTKGAATLSAASTFSSRLLTSGAVQRVGEYVVGMQATFSLADADGKIAIPQQTLNLSHEFAVDQTQLVAISSETEAIQRSLVREMTDAVMRRLEAHAYAAPPAPASAASAP